MASNDPKKPFEQWAAEKSTAPWLLGVAVSLNSWPVGREVTEAAFSTAISEAATTASPGCYPVRGAQ